MTAESRGQGRTLGKRVNGGWVFSLGTPYLVFLEKNTACYPHGAADLRTGLSRRNDKPMWTHCRRPPRDAVRTVCSGLTYPGVGFHLTHARIDSKPYRSLGKVRLWTPFLTQPQLLGQRPALRGNKYTIIIRCVSQQQMEWMNEVNKRQVIYNSLHWYNGSGQRTRRGSEWLGWPKGHVAPEWKGLELGGPLGTWGACGWEGALHSGSLLEIVAERISAGGASVWNLLPEEEVGETGNRFRRWSPQERRPLTGPVGEVFKLKLFCCLFFPHGPLPFWGHKSHISKPFSKR